MNTPFYIFMKLLPKNAASRAFGALTRLRLPVISKVARNAFAAYYKLNMEEAEYPLEHYANIGELFIRHLKPGARPIAESEIVSPVDGVLSQTATFDERQEMIQAKGKTYTLKDLLRDDEMAKRFEGGAFATIYLAPFNYHRIHSPVAGTVVALSMAQMIPSVRARYSKAETASSSVTGTYWARPVSWSHACSGPMPG